MAEVLASLKKIGGNGEQYTETVLWTNPSPSSSFDSQYATLSDSISNYKYIKFVYLISKGGTAEMDLYVATDKLRMTSGTNDSFALGLNSFGTSSGTIYPWSRVVYYVSDTSILFHHARAINVSITQDQRLIPKEILGINELAHGTIYEHYATGYFTQAQPSVDLGFVPKYVFCANATSNNANTVIYDANVSTTQFRFIAGGIDEMRNIGAIGSTNQFNMSGTTIGMNPNTSWSAMTGNHRQYVAIGYDNQ